MTARDHTPATGFAHDHPNREEFTINFHETDILVRDRDMPRSDNASSIRLPMTGQLPVHIKLVRRTRDIHAVLRAVR